jgi:chemotaxis protein CheX
LSVTPEGGVFVEAKYIDPFVVGARNVFKTMLDIDLDHDEPFQKTSNRTTADVTGVMGFTGDRRGTMSFSVTKSGALAIYGKLMREHFQEVTSEVMDAMGELTNIISGQARKELERIDLHVMAHVPLVFVGRGVEITLATKGTIMSIPFSFTVDGRTETMSLDCVFE